MKLAVLVLSALAAAPAFGDVRPAIADAQRPLPAGAVRLGGQLGRHIDLSIRARVGAQDVDHLVQPFRERRDTWEWRSEFWGKWITSAIAAQGYSADRDLERGIATAVSSLLATQSADGYIGAYPDGGRRQRWDIWGRKYTLLGLLARYDATGDAKVLDAARRHADRLLAEVGPGKASPFENDMWHGMASSSVLEPIVLLYRRSGRPEYLDFARHLVRQWETPGGPDLLRKALGGVAVFRMFPGPLPVVKEYGDAGSSKAYEMMSCFEGLAELHRVTGEPSFRAAVSRVAEDIRSTEITVIGSGSDWERWCDGRQRQAEPWHKGMETCVTVTWMKLADQLLRLSGEPRWADEIERAAYNALLGAHAGDGSWWSHHSPLAGVKERAPEQCDMRQNCCVANGPRGLLLLPRFAVMADDAGPVVNLLGPLAADVTLASGNRVRLDQAGEYPENGTIRLRVTADRPEEFTVKLRIPAWSKRTTLMVAGRPFAVEPGTYASIRRTWAKADEVQLELDMRARAVPAPGAPGHVAVERGPLVLARDRRLEPGDVDAPAAIAADPQGVVTLAPLADKPAGVWMGFRVPVSGGGEIPMCDFASAGTTWSEESRYRVFVPRPKH